MNNPSMRTMGVLGLPGLGWLDSFMKWPPYVRLPSITCLSLILLVIPAALGAEIKESAALLATILMAGATLAVIVILARGAQDDMIEAGGIEHLARLAPTPHQIKIEFSIALLAGFLALLYFGHFLDDDALGWVTLFTPEVYGSLSTGTLVNEWLLAIFVWLSGVLIVYAVGSSRRQLNHYRHWADTIAIDLMHVEECQVFTLQPIRYLLVFVIFTSLNIIVYQVLTSMGFGDEVLAALAPLLILMLGFVFPFLGPVTIVRNRIAEAKLSEIAAVRAALTGNRKALEASQIAELADEFAAPDLLMYEQYVRNIWEWPVQGYVQRILLYVLLPPLAWVLAALVEQVVDGFVG